MQIHIFKVCSQSFVKEKRKEEDEKGQVAEA